MSSIVKFWNRIWSHMCITIYPNSLVLVDDNAMPHRASIVLEALTEGDIGRLIGHCTVQIWTQQNICGMSWATDWKEYILSHSLFRNWAILAIWGFYPKLKAQGPWWTVHHIVYRPWWQHMVAKLITKMCNSNKSGDNHVKFGVSTIIIMQDTWILIY